MSCRTCDHTMHSLGERTFWCPRCGTVKGDNYEQLPKLVTRVIEFGGLLTDEHEDLIEAFERLGIRESICPDGMV